MRTSLSVVGVLAASLSSGLPQTPGLHPRDLLAKTLMPVAQAFAADTTTGGDGIDATFIVHRPVGDASPVTPAAVARARLLFDAPSRIMVEVTTREAGFVVCRDGGRVWAAPRNVVEPLLARLGKPGAGAAPSSSILADMRLPLDRTAIGFLPALLDVGDRGIADINGVSCRVVEAVPQPELASQFPQLAGWRFVAWIEPSAPRLVRVNVENPTLAFRLDIVALKTSLALPDALWLKPDSDDAIDVPPSLLMSLPALLADTEFVDAFAPAPPAEVTP